MRRLELETGRGHVYYELTIDTEWLQHQLDVISADSELSPSQIVSFLAF
jgi:hypothetical protein